MMKKLGSLAHVCRRQGEDHQALVEEAHRRYKRPHDISRAGATDGSGEMRGGVDAYQRSFGSVRGAQRVRCGHRSDFGCLSSGY